MKRINANVELMLAFLIINNVGMISNVGVNVKNESIKVCDKGFIWYPSNCEYECDKTCDAGEYLDYEICKYEKKIS